MKKLIADNNGSIYPVLIFILCLGVVSVTLLLAGNILEPFFNLMQDGAMKSFLLVLFPYGIAGFFLIVLIFTLVLEMQKSKYKEI